MHCEKDRQCGENNQRNGCIVEKTVKEGGALRRSEAKEEGALCMSQGD